MRVFSDLHIEFDRWSVTKPKDHSEILILAGDIAPLNKTYLSDFIKACADTHEHVIYVAGNHEYYGGTLTKAWDEYEVPSNVYKLENQRIEINGQGFIGCTLWSDLGNPLDALVAKQMMYDYRAIKTPNYSKVGPHHTTALHYQSAEYLSKNIQKGDVVVTHHMPTYACVAAEYKGDPLNPAFVTELSELIEQTEPSMWISGHTHHAFSFMWGKTRLHCNPRGYPGEKTGFDPEGYVWEL
jgi:Icc-related predicted phosphoesterase